MFILRRHIMIHHFKESCNWRTGKFRRFPSKSHFSVAPGKTFQKAASSGSCCPWCSKYLHSAEWVWWHSIHGGSAWEPPEWESQLSAPRSMTRSHSVTLSSTPPSYHPQFSALGHCSARCIYRLCPPWSHSAPVIRNVQIYFPVDKKWAKIAHSSAPSDKFQLCSSRAV